MAEKENSPSRTLSLPVMFSFAFGGVGQAAVAMGIYGFLLFYYQQIVGLSGSLTGLALGIALVVDGISDPLIGSISDRFRSRFGRRHPMMLFAIIPTAISFILLYSPPDELTQTGYFIWLTFFTVAVRTAITFYNVPHLALGAEMAKNYEQRSSLFAMHTVISGIGGAGLGVAVYWIIFPTTETFNPGTLNPDGYIVFGLAAAAIMSVTMLATVLGTSREIPHLSEPDPRADLSMMNLLREMAEVFRDRDFLAIFLGFLLWYLFGFIEMVGMPFMALHFWELRTEDLAYLQALNLVALLLAFFLMPIATRVLDKKKTLIFSSLTAIVLPNILICSRLIDAPWYPENGSPWVLYNYLGAAFVGVIASTLCGASYYSVYADIADSHELKTGKRMEGMIYATQQFSSKAAGALGLMIGGAVLDFIEFPKMAAQGSIDSQIIWELGFFVGPATSIFSAVGIGMFLFYRIDRARHAEIVEALRTTRDKN